MNSDYKCIITAAVTGADTIPSQGPYLPITPQEIADEAVRSAEAGAAVVHIHARDPKTGEPSSDLDLFEEILVSIKERSDVIICPTTGGNPTMSLEERLQVLPRFKPEMATLNMGSMNFSTHFLLKSFERQGRDFTHDWERPYLEGTKDAVFRNSFGDMEFVIGMMNDNDVRPECEIYDLGMINNTAYLVKQGLLTGPLQIQFVLGILGGANAEVGVLNYFKSVADTTFGAGSYSWSIIGAGYPQEFDLGALSVLLGGSIRVGMEDNLRLSRGVFAKSNAELVEKAVNIVEVLDRQVATPDEARKILGLKGAENVAF